MDAILSQEELKNARLLAELSELAYRPQSEIEEGLSALNLSLEEFFNESLPGTQGFCAKGKDFACFVFRGTSVDKSEDIHRFEDVLIDLLAWPVPAVRDEWESTGRSGGNPFFDFIGRGLSSGWPAGLEALQEPQTSIQELRDAVRLLQTDQNALKAEVEDIRSRIEKEIPSKAV